MSVLIFSILTNFIYYCFGCLISLNKKNKFGDQFYIFFIGAVGLSFISLILNFIVPLNSTINSFIYFLIIVIFFFKFKTRINKKTIIFLIISSIITFLLIIYSNVNRPDAGLYHLPYISLIHENKIIFGINNLHFRFGHISIIQYLQAINKNYIFFDNGILIPLASIVSFFYIYFFNNILEIIQKREKIKLESLFSLFVLIYIAYKISNYSNFGNDAIGHLSVFYLVSIFLKEKIKIINLNKILIITVFIIANKPMLGMVIIIPFFIFFYQNKINFKKMLLVSMSVPSLCLYLWFIKNIITSGCIIYPIKVSCFKNLSWTDYNEVILRELEGSAWSKAWPDRIDKNITMEEYNINFNWLNAWSKKHLIYILEILIPYILLILFITFYLLRKKNNYYSKSLLVEDNYKIALLFSLVGSISFFIFFPLYRYGYSYLITFLILLFICICKNKIENLNNIYVFKIIFTACIVVIIGKQMHRIYQNKDNLLWPNIYSLEKNNNKIKAIRKDIDKKFIYYLAFENEKLCMYSPSPCTSYELSKEIKYTKKANYSFLEIK
jgi:hypothetical protein